MKNLDGGARRRRLPDVHRRPLGTPRVPSTLLRTGPQGPRGGLPAQGFTLVELMVVIAIIIILVAITISVYRSVRESVKQKACMANLQQIVIALQRYRVEEGSYPGPYDPVTGQGGMNALYPYYVDNRKAFICPDDPITDGQAYVDQHGPLLAAADAVGMYTEPVWENRWRDKAFFSEHYSSYNALYNYMGYVGVEGDYSLCGYATQHMGIGDSIAWWYEWYRWDPEGKLGYAIDESRFSNVIDPFLHYHLAQQVYWAGYLDNPYNDPEDPSRLMDNLERPLWDVGDAPWNPGMEGWYPYGVYGAYFPGLVNANAPPHTIVTRCPYHRAWTTVRVPAQGPGGGGGRGNAPRGHLEGRQDETPRDIVLRLDGSCSLVRGYGYDWARQE